MNGEVATVGSDNAGFSVEVDDRSKTIRVSGWGFWEVEVAQAFDSAVLGPCKRWPGNFRVEMDMSRLKPMRNEGQAAFANVVSALRDQGCAKASVTTASHLTRLQLLRITHEAGGKDLLDFIDQLH